MFPIIILAGGYGTRLGDLTKDKPKSLVDINGEPFLTHQIELLYNNGFRDFWFCLGYEQDQIISELKKYKFKIRFSTNNQELGTGGAVKRIAKEIKDDNFFVIYGDSYLRTNYYDIQLAYNRHNKNGLMVIYKEKNGNIEYNNSEIVKYDKVNKGLNYIDYGLSIFNKNYFESIKEDSFDLSLVHNKLIEEKNIVPYIENIEYFEVGSLEGLENFKNFIIRKEKLWQTIYRST